MSGPVAATTAARRRGVLRNFVALSTSAWVQQVLNFATVVYLASVLGADGFGQVAMAQSIVLYFRLSSDMGLDLLGARRMARAPADAAGIVSAFTGARLVNAVVAGLVLLPAAAAIHVVRPVGWLVAAFGLLLAPLALSLEWAFSGLERMEVVGTYRVLAAGSWLAVVIFFVRTPGAILVVPLANVAAMSAAALLLFTLFRRRYGAVAPTFRFDRWRSLMREAMPIGLSLLVIQVYVGFGVIALGLVEGERAAGLYAAPQRVVLFLTTISSMFGAALYPRLSALHAQDRDSFERLLSLGFRTMILIGAPLGVGGVLVAPSLMSAMYAPEYQAGAPVFRWLVPSVVLIFASVPLGYALLAAGRQRAYFRAAVAGALVNIVATLALIPYVHLLGPAIATLMTEALVFTVLLVGVRDVGRVTGGRAIASAAVSVAAMAAALVWVRPGSLTVQVLLGGGVYTAALVASGGLRRNDLEALRANWGRRP